jgi:hypothetical protein
VIPSGGLLLQLSLPGATRFLGRVTAQGCQELTQADPGASRILSCDGLDRRVCHSEALSHRLVVQMLDDLDPGVAFQVLRNPADPRVAYARPLDDISPEVPTSPLCLALDALFPSTADEKAVAVLEIGPASAPDLLLMAGRDEQGLIDPATLQIWIHPRDSTANIAREFAARAALHFDSATPVLHQQELLACIESLPAYPRSREFLGRDLDHWTRLGLHGLGLALALSLASATSLHYWRASLQARVDEDGAKVAALREEIAAALAASPHSLVQAASIDLPPLILAAREVWMPGATVQLTAHGSQGALQVHWKVPHPAPSGAGAAGPGTGSARTVDDPHFYQDVSRGWLRPAPRGFVRTDAQLNGDGDEIAIHYQTAPVAPGPALRALD